MSVRVMNWVFENSAQRLGNRLVLLALADAADDDGRNAFPAVATIARKARLSEREAQYCLRDLQRQGVITMSAGSGPHGTNSYAVSMDSGGVQNLHPTAPEAGADIAPGGAKHRTRGVHPCAPNPSLPGDETKNPEPELVSSYPDGSGAKRDIEAERRLKQVLSQQLSPGDFAMWVRSSELWRRDEGWELLVAARHARQVQATMARGITHLLIPLVGPSGAVLDIGPLPEEAA